MHSLSGTPSGTPTGTQSGTRAGTVLVVVPGGARESLDWKPGTNVLTLLKRKGFVRVCLETGTPLVPVFSFGENDIYENVVDNPPNSKFRKFQEKMLEKVQFPLVLFVGRGGLLPKKKKNCDCGWKTDRNTKSGKSE